MEFYYPNIVLKIILFLCTNYDVLLFLDAS